MDSIKNSLSLSPSDLSVCIIDPNRHLGHIETIEQACFPPEMRHAPHDFVEFISNKYSMGLLLTKKRTPLGYISGTHMCDDYSDLYKLDERIGRHEDTMFYIDNICVVPEARSGVVLDFLIFEMFSLLKGYCYDYVVAHVRKANGLSRLVRMRYRAESIGTIENWENTGEAFECMLFVLSKFPANPKTSSMLQRKLRRLKQRLDTINKSKRI